MTDLRLMQQKNAQLPIKITDLENTTVSSDLNSRHNLSGISVTSSATMRWTTLCGIDSALVGVNVKVTMVEG
jgi:hypothetical protein